MKQYYNDFECNNPDCVHGITILNALCIEILKDGKCPSCLHTLVKEIKVSPTEAKPIWE